eukprot:m.252911 g.252911  ORF g.252911 m.252911 type:complete len:475 (+) comp10992_c0_seq4:1930-3354(+)
MGCQSVRGWCAGVIRELHVAEASVNKERRVLNRLAITARIVHVGLSSVAIMVVNRGWRRAVDSLGMQLCDRRAWSDVHAARNAKRCEASHVLAKVKHVHARRGLVHITRRVALPDADGRQNGVRRHLHVRAGRRLHSALDPAAAREPRHGPTRGLCTCVVVFASVDVCAQYRAAVGSPGSTAHNILRRAIGKVDAEAEEKLGFADMHRTLSIPAVSKRNANGMRCQALPNSIVDDGCDVPRVIVHALLVGGEGAKLVVRRLLPVNVELVVAQADKVGSGPRHKALTCQNKLGAQLCHRADADPGSALPVSLGVQASGKGAVFGPWRGVVAGVPVAHGPLKGAISTQRRAAVVHVLRLVGCRSARIPDKLALARDLDLVRRLLLRALRVFQRPGEAHRISYVHTLWRIAVLNSQSRWCKNASRSSNDQGKKRQQCGQRKRQRGAKAHCREWFVHKQGRLGTAAWTKCTLRRFWPT